MFQHYSYVKAFVPENEAEDVILTLSLVLLFLLLCRFHFHLIQIQYYSYIIIMSPPSSSDDTTNRNDAAINGNVLVRFLPMRSSTSFLVEAQTDANDFTDLEGNHHNNNSSEAEAGRGQEVERRVSGGGDGGDPSMDMDLQVDSSSSDTSSHPSNGVADTNNHRRDRRKGWISKPNCGSIGLPLLVVVVVVACVYTIIDNNEKKNVLISDLQTEISSLKNKEQQYLLDISQLGSEQVQKGGGKKGKAGKDECCACLTSSVRLLSNVYTILCLMFAM